MILNRPDCVVVFLFYQVTISYQWNPPSFISSWTSVTIPFGSNPEIPHGLNELPVKVDVQIKVVKNGVDYIFTGTGTMQRDDDESEILGGIVYAYNAQKVVLYPPATSGIGVAYSGSSTDFNGPTSARGLFSDALVRVRAWKASDFPSPLFTLNVPVSDTSTNCFKQIPHNSVVKPDLVVAQVQLSNGLFSEGQGNIFLSDTACATCALNGVVFGFDSDQVKLWVPIQKGPKAYSGAVFGYGDGFGTYSPCCGGYAEDSATVVLKGYQLDKAFQTIFTHGTALASPNDISFGESFSLDTALVMVQVREHLGTANNPGMVFNGAGSAMAGSLKYSGVVYAYNENNALLYTPSSSNPNGYMIYLGDRWGNGEHPSNEESADVIVTVFSDVFCPDPTVDSTSHILTNGLSPGSSVQYTCDCGLYHTSGNITRYCNFYGNWEGDAPNCTKCHDPGSVYSATYSLSDIQLGSTATYTCDVGSQYLAGDTIRYCLEDGTWSGIPIVCGNTVSSGLTSCPNPGDVYNATYTLIGENVTYTCISGSSPVAGDTVRTCQPNGSWSGIPVVCVAMQSAPVGTVCTDPGDVFNASYTLMSGTATYTCISGSSQVAGDSVRTCQPNGSWSGIPVVCVAMQSAPAASSNSNPVTYTSESLAESIEETKKVLTVEKKSTNSYRRSLTSASDARPSAFYIGTAGVLVLCSVVAAVIGPDLLTIFKHFRNYGTIYRNEN